MMSPSGHTVPADTGENNETSLPTTQHGIAVGVDGSAPSNRKMSPCAPFHPLSGRRAAEPRHPRATEKFVHLLDTLGSCLSVDEVPQNSPNQRG